MKNKTVKVDYLARVEGEGALHIKVKKGTVTDVKFKIFEPPRLFEGFLKGRLYSEAPDITARICGICPVAYQMSSVHAMEYAFGVKVNNQLRDLRRLLYCGEWIESHALHIYLLHAPDFLGYEDAIQLGKDHPDVVTKALKLKKIGNDLVALLGGREIHPINVRVGGFYKLPEKSEFDGLLEPLEWALQASIDTVRLTAGLPFPDYECDYEYVALRNPGEYPFNEGRLVSNRGLDIAISEYETRFSEEHIKHANALHSVINGRGGYLVGPLARYNLNFDQLTPLAQDLAREAKLGEQCHNPYKSIIVRAVETVYACEEAIRIIKGYQKPGSPVVDFVPRAGIGFGCTEAPRGILYHRYRLDERGEILNAKIVPPTAQNQKAIEKDLHDVVAKFISKPEKELTWLCEQTVRNYDPCISCATHFIRLHIERE